LIQADHLIQKKKKKKKTFSLRQPERESSTDLAAKIIMRTCGRLDG
jgi:hypothetical protein